MRKTGNKTKEIVKEKKLFVVEDNDLFAMVINHNIKEKYNFSVSYFSDGESCIKNLNKKPDIIILDYFLKGMNGLETLKEIKKKNDSIPIIILSSQKDLGIAAKLMKEGAYSYIEKDNEFLAKLFKEIDFVFN